MKVKLLKKIRKRFSIIKVNERPSDPNHFTNRYTGNYKTPFFYLTDEKDVFNVKLMYSSGYDIVYNEMLRRIRKSYTHKVKKNNGQITKVWW